MSLVDFGNFLTQIAAPAAQILGGFGVGDFGRSAGIPQQTQAIFGMPGSGFPVQQASLGGALARQLPGIIGGLGAGEVIDQLSGGQVAGGACIVPTSRVTTSLPRTVDVPTADAAGNVKISTYVRAPRVRYKVSIRPARRHHHHTRG